MWDFFTCSFRHVSICLAQVAIRVAMCGIINSDFWISFCFNCASFFSRLVRLMFLFFYRTLGFFTTLFLGGVLSCDSQLLVVTNWLIKSLSPSDLRSYGSEEPSLDWSILDSSFLLCFRSGRFSFFNTFSSPLLICLLRG